MSGIENAELLVRRPTVCTLYLKFIQVFFVAAMGLKILESLQLLQRACYPALVKHA